MLVEAFFELLGQEFALFLLELILLLVLQLLLKNLFAALKDRLDLTVGLYDSVRHLLVVAHQLLALLRDLDQVRLLLGDRVLLQLKGLDQLLVARFDIVQLVDIELVVHRVLHHLPL